MGVVRNIMVRAVADFSSLQSASNELQQNMNKMADGVGRSVNRMNREASKISHVGALIGGLKRELLGVATMYFGLEGLKDATKAAMEYEAQMGNLTHTLQDQTQSFLDWGNTTGRTFGYGEADVVKYGTQFANLVSTFSHGQGEIKDKTEKLLETSAIIANGTGRSIDDVMERMRSGLLGNVQAINDLGIYANNSMIQTSKAFHDIAHGRHWADLKFQEQQQIIYMSLMEQAATKYGTTIQQNTHLKVNQFIGILKDLRVALGNVILPILNRVLPVLNAMAFALLKVMNIAAQFSKALFGKAVWGDTAKTKNQSAAINDQSGAVKNLTDSVKKLHKAKKESQGSLAGFDQVNTLNNSNGADATADKPDNTGLELPAPDHSLFDEAMQGVDNTIIQVSQSVKDFVDKVKAWLSPLTPYWDRLVQSVKDVGQALQDLWDSPGFQSLLKWAGDSAKWAVMKAMDLLTDGFKIIKDTIKILTDYLNGDSKKAWDDTKKLFSDVGDLLKDGGVLSVGIAGIGAGLLAMSIGERVVEVLKFAAAIREWTAGYILLEAAQLALNIAMDANPVGAVALAIAGLVAAGVLLYQNWDTVTKWASTLWDKITSNKDAIIAMTGPIGLLVEAGKKLYDNWGDITKKAGELWTSVTDAFKGVDIKGWFKTNVTDDIVKAFDGANQLGSDIYKGLTKGFGSIQTWFEENVSKKINSAFTYTLNLGGHIWDGLKTGFVDVSKWFGDNVSTKINSAFGYTLNLGTHIWEGLKKGYTGVQTWFTTNVANPIKEAFKNITSGLGGALSNGFLTIYKKFAGFYNSAVDTIDTFWKNVTGHKTSIHHMPATIALANGGVTNGPVHALIGDNPGGREIVSPLNKMQDYMASTVTNAILTANAMSGGQSSNGNRLNQDININIDGRTFARIVKPYIDQENKRVGTNVRLTSI
jgi:uncharacterized protein YoxC